MTIRVTIFVKMFMFRIPGEFSRSLLVSSDQAVSLMETQIIGV